MDCYCAGMDHSRADHNGPDGIATHRGAAEHCGANSGYTHCFDTSTTSGRTFAAAAG